MSRGQRDDLFTPAVKERIGGDQKRACPQLHAGFEGRFEVALAAGVDDMELEPEHPRSLGYIVCLDRCSGLARIDQHGDHSRAWNQLMQQAQPLRFYLGGEEGHPGDVAAGPVETGD
jgi:hypothetical protein